MGGETVPPFWVDTMPHPPLENGDRLTAPEFERHYAAMPEHQKAELIEGVVYMASPLRFTSHAELHGRLITWLGVYQAATPFVAMGLEPTVRLDIDNEVQPDGVLLLPGAIAPDSRGLPPGRAGTGGGGCGE